MKPAYFPFTTMGPLLLDSLAACPGPVIVYRPSRLNLPAHLQQAADAGRIDIRTPEVEDEAELERRIDAYRDWVRLHAGSEIGWLKAQGDAVPFHDAGSTSGIRNDLRRRMEGSDSPGAGDALFAARLFLEIAQERDHRQWEVQQELVRFDAKEKELYRELRPDAAADLPLQPAFSGETDPGLTMIDERMAAWARLMLASPGPRPQWLVTDSAEAIEWVRERIAGVSAVSDGSPLTLSFEDNPSQRQALAAFVADLARGQGEPGLPDILGGSSGGGDLQVVLYRVPGTSLDQLVGHWACQRHLPPPPPGDRGGAAHSVFARIQAV